MNERLAFKEAAIKAENCWSIIAEHNLATVIERLLQKLQELQTPAKNVDQESVPQEEDHDQNQDQNQDQDQDQGRPAKKQKVQLTLGGTKVEPSAMTVSKAFCSWYRHDLYKKDPNASSQDRAYSNLVGSLTAYCKRVMNVGTEIPVRPAVTNVDDFLHWYPAMRGRSGTTCGARNLLRRIFCNARTELYTPGAANFPFKPRGTRFCMRSSTSLLVERYQ
jgi:hypothetical protein